MKREYLYFLCIIILMILIFIAIFGKNENETQKVSSNIETTTNINNEKTIPNGQIGIVKHKYDGSCTIEVYIKNNTGKEINLVKVKASCKDKNGINLGTYSGYQTNVNTNDIYKIKILCSSDTSKYNLDLSYE